jgi:dipeptidyl-peptidase-4
MPFAAWPLALVLCAFQQAVPRDERIPLTVEWTQGDGPGEIAAVPRHQWLDDGTLALLDVRKPPPERTLERLDPATLERTPLVDAAKARASLKDLTGIDAPPTFGWPVDLDRRGKVAVYIAGGDVFALDLASSTFRRLTETPEEEKCVQLSPDGTLVAYVRNKDLYVHPTTGDGGERRLTRDGDETTLNGTLSWVYWEEIFGRRDIGYWWSPDSTAIAYLQTDESPVDLTYFVDFQPVVPAVHTQRYPRAGRPNPKVRVGVVGVTSDGPETAWVAVDPASYEYVARVQWLPDSKRLSVQTMPRTQNRLTLHVVDRDGQAPRVVLEESDDAWVNIHDDLRFLGDGEEFLWASERDGFAHLYRYRLDGALVNRVTSGEWAIRSSGDGPFWLRQALVGVDEEAGWVYFTALEKASTESHLYRVRLDGTGFERLTREDGTHTIDVSPDGRFYVDRFSDIRTPPALRLHTADGEQKAVLAGPRTDLLARLDLVYPEQFTIPTRDGFAMPAEMVKPRGFDPSKRYPLILYVYGGPSAPTVLNKWRGSLFYDNVLAADGYLVALVDHRAATAISHALETRLFRVMSGEVERADVLDAVAWLKGQTYVDPDRVGVWGWSGGGSFTLNLMTHSDAFKAGIAIAAVTDWRYYDTKWAEFAMRTPDENPAGYDATSFVKSAKDLHGRLLLVHGTYDDNVHPQNAWAFADALIAHNIPFEMMMYPMRQHGIADRAARVHLFSTMRDFWARHLK